MATSTTRQVDQIAQGDDLDELFDYEPPAENRHHGSPNRNGSSGPNGRLSTNNSGAQNSANLGIDEEITIAKKRQPIAKLDDNRLLSSAGIPKLRKISKERLRFKGKGHEFSDIARLLNMYQLWLDDLYPRAKFADGLAIIEKLGHSKRIQMMRREWINEGKPKPTVELEDNDDIHQEREEQQPSASDVVNGESHEQEHQSDRSDEMPRKKQTPRPDPAAKSAEAGAEEPDEDELDALLAEAESNDIERPGSIVNRNPGTEAGQTSLPKPTEEDPFADEMEAMEGLDDW